MRKLRNQGGSSSSSGAARCATFCASWLTVICTTAGPCLATRSAKSGRIAVDAPVDAAAGADTGPVLWAFGGLYLACEAYRTLGGGRFRVTALRPEGQSYLPLVEEGFYKAWGPIVIAVDAARVDPTFLLAPVLYALLFRHHLRIEAARLRAIGDRMRSCFERAGYGEVHTPALEYEDVLRRGEERAAELLRRYGHAFPEGYKADHSPRAAVAAYARSASAYITGRFKSGSPPKNVSTRRSGAMRSSSRSIQSATRWAVAIDIFPARSL